MNVMSNLDMTSSFWHPDSRKYTAFQYRDRSYEFKVVPFGLKTSTIALVRGLDHVILGMGENIITFVDDTLITSENCRQHFEHLNETLTRLEDNNLTSNLTKSHFFREETKFLGFILTTEGIKPDQEKISRLHEFPALCNVK